MVSVFIEEKYDTIPFARQVLGSKCKLLLGNSGPSIISLLDAEKLIQVLRSEIFYIQRFMQTELQKFTVTAL